MTRTFEIYKRDRRRRDGRRMITKIDFDFGDDVQRLFNKRGNLCQAYPFYRGYEIEEHDTWVTRTNSQTGREYRERYDTPRSCSPASDLYWSM